MADVDALLEDYTNEHEPGGPVVRRRSPEALRQGTSGSAFLTPSGRIYSIHPAPYGHRELADWLLDDLGLPAATASEVAIQHHTGLMRLFVRNGDVWLDVFRKLTPAQRSALGQIRPGRVVADLHAGDGRTTFEGRFTDFMRELERRHLGNPTTMWWLVPVALVALGWAERR